MGEVEAEDDGGVAALPIGIKSCFVPVIPGLFVGYVLWLRSWFFDQEPEKGGVALQTSIEGWGFLNA